MTLYHSIPTICNPWNPWFPFLFFCLLRGRLGIQRGALATWLNTQDIRCVSLGNLDPRWVSLGNMNTSCVVSICYFDHLTHRCLQIFQLSLWALRVLTSIISWLWWFSSRRGYSTYLDPSSSWGRIYFSTATLIEVVVSPVIYYLLVAAHWHYFRLRFSRFITSIVGKSRTSL